MSSSLQEQTTVETETAGSESPTDESGGTLRSLAVLAIGFTLVQLAFTTLPIVSFLPLAGLVGLFGAAFLTGLLDSSTRYLSVGAMGLLSGGVVTGIRYSSEILSGYPPTVSLAFGFGGGLLVALLGYYFARDLKAGIAQELP